MTRRRAGALALLAASVLLLVPGAALAQEVAPTPVPTVLPQVEPPIEEQPLETPQEQSTLDSLGLLQEDLPPGFVPIPLFFLRYAPWDVGGDSSWHEFARGDDYVTSTVSDVFSPERAWEAFPQAIAPSGSYGELWLDPPAVGDESAMFQLSEFTLAGTQRGHEVKWRHGRFMARVTVLGVTDDPSFAVGLAQLVDSRIASADPGQLGEVPEAQVYEISRQVQELRGLPARGRSDFSMVAPAVFGSLADLIQAQVPGLELGLLEMLGQEVDLVSLTGASFPLEGVYTPTSNHVTIFGNSWPLGPYEQIVLAHEFDHAITDQHFGLTSVFIEALRSTTPNSDVVLGARSLPEGDAEYTSHLWTDQYLGPAAWDELDDITDRAIETARVPELWRSQALFPYREGEQFIRGFHGDGGWSTVNLLYTRAPISSEQVMHPDKYVANELPIQVDPPEESGVATRGWHALRVDTLGELGLRATLEPFLGRASAEAGAAGWGGDTFLLVGLDDEHPKGLVLDSEWDDTFEAAEFSALLADSLDVRFADETSRRVEGANRLSWSTRHFQVSVERDGAFVRFGVAPDRESLAALAPSLR